MDHASDRASRYRFRPNAGKLLATAIEGDYLPDVRSRIWRGRARRSMGVARSIARDNDRYDSGGDQGGGYNVKGSYR